jgi:Fic family protein
MNIKDFIAGQWKNGYEYKYFSPALINHEFFWADAKLSQLLEQAAFKIGELNALARIVPNVDIFIKMHILKEALLSSRIEGTQTQISEALQDKQEIEPERRDDWQEVTNYVKAMNFAIHELTNLPLCNRLLQKTHETLLCQVRGETKIPGEFRTSQNWIGGASLKDAIFIPPHHDEVLELMSDLEKFLNNDLIYVPHLIKIAIAHYQFETIHPFLDGNGRLGRLLITLYLVSNKILDKPLLYTSYFFERNKNLYYDNLMVVREKNDLQKWLIFFLTAIVETAEKSIQTLHNILSLKEEIENHKIITLGRKLQNAQRLHRFLLEQPVIKIQQVVEKLNISPKTANEIVTDFVKLSILKETTGYQRNRVFIYQKYLDLFEK